MIRARVQRAQGSSTNTACPAIKSGYEERLIDWIPPATSTSTSGWIARRSMTTKNKTEKSRPVVVAVLHKNRVWQARDAQSLHHTSKYEVFPTTSYLSHTEKGGLRGANIQQVLDSVRPRVYGGHHAKRNGRWRPTGYHCSRHLLCCAI